MDKIYKCTVTCTFRVMENRLDEYIPQTGIIAGFKLRDGRTVRPIIGMEIESKDDGSQYKCVTSQNEMAKLGLEDMEYDVSDFQEDELLSENLENEEYEAMPIENVPANLEPRFDSTREIIERRLKEGK
jgi:hypothetical protein